MLAIVCPGQGSQTQGFLSPWIEDSGARETLEQYSEFSETDLVTHGTLSDEDTIRDTAVAQPLIVAASLLSARALSLTGWTPAESGSDGESPVFFAGHSVGEIPAATLAGVFTEEQALRLIRVRAQAMAEAAADTPTGMVAVVGGSESEVVQAVADAGLTAANANGPGQLVAAGAKENIAALQDAPPAKARVIPLKVAGAFHTEYMAPAEEKLAAAVAAYDTSDPRTPLLSNKDGAPVTEGREVLQRIIHQVTRPVRWDLCMETMRNLHVTGILELAPGGTLTGLAKRGLKGVATLAVKSPEDLDQAKAFISEHAV